MRLLLILPFFLIACAPSNKHEDADVTCEWQADPVDIQYPDGVIRKSDVFVCSNGCTTYRYVNNATITFNTCD